MYTKEQIDKIGNSIVFLASQIKGISKTKLLKLLYILDEISLKKSGIPFFNLEYKVWKFGPVANDIFVELSSSPSMLKDFIIRETTKDGHTFISPKKDFIDDEFTQNELDLLGFVVKKFKNSSANELISFTHRKASPWYNAAIKNSVYELLVTEQISSTEIKVEMKELVEYDERKKQIYEDYLEYY
ncbi:MAG: SocA family protein [Bacteroidetes bacterium]|nr:SocA family protein [Bacteroidota bacterium]